MTLREYLPFVSEPWWKRISKMMLTGALTWAGFKTLENAITVVTPGPFVKMLLYGMVFVGVVLLGFYPEHATRKTKRAVGSLTDRVRSE